MFNCELLIVREANGFFAIEDSCPHAGASLSNGRIESGKVRCRAHGLWFNLSTGRCTVGDLALKVYACRVHDGLLEVRLTSLNETGSQTV